MEIKRVFKTDNDGQPTDDLDYVRVSRVSKRQNFTQRFIDRAIQEGFASLVKGELVIHARPDELIYKILRMPGYFCCHDNAPLGSEKEAVEYLDANFDGAASPDANNPAGYRKDNFLACELQGAS